MCFKCIAKGLIYMYQIILYNLMTYIRLFSITNYYKILNSPLCYRVKPLCLSILCIEACICVHPLTLINLYPLPFHFGKHKFVFFVYDCVSVLYIDSFVLLYKFHK